MPPEERTRLINLAQFDEDLDDWVIRKEKKRPLPRERLTIHKYRRPVTDYALDKDGIRYRVGATPPFNVLFLILLFLG